MPIVNTAAVDTNQTGPAQATATTTVTPPPPSPAIVAITKVADKANVSVVNEAIHYFITVTNPGLVPLTGVVLTDPFAPNLRGFTGDTNGNSILEPAETWRWITSHDVTAGEISAGVPIVNTAAVDTNQTGAVQASASSTVTQAAPAPLGNVSGDGSSRGESPRDSARQAPAAQPSRPPRAVNDVYAARQNSALVVRPGVLSNDRDLGGESASARLVTTVSRGNLVLNLDGSFTYTPERNWTGSVVFTYRALSGAAMSNVATVTIRVER